MASKEDDWIIEAPSADTLPVTKPAQVAAAAPKDDWVIEAGPTGVRLGDIARAFVGQGMMMGWGDEATARLRQMSHGETYDAALTDERRKTKAFREKHPEWAHGLEFAGGMAVPGLGLLTKTIKPAASVVGQMVQGSGLGAGIGAVAGAGGSDKDRLEGAGTGALIGVGLGAGIPVAGAVGSGLFHKAREAVSPSLARTRGGVEAAADEVLANKIRASGKTVADVQADLSAGRAAAKLPKSEAVLPEMIIDTLPGLQRVGGSVYRAGNEAGELMQGSLAARQGGDPAKGLFGRPGMRAAPMNQYERLGDDFKRAWGVKSKDLEKELATIRNEQKVLGNQDYKNAWATADKFDEPLTDTLVAWSLKTKNEPGRAEQTALQSALKLFERQPPRNPQTETMRLQHEKLGDRLQALTERHAEALASGQTALAERLARQVQQTERQAQIVMDRLAETNTKIGNQPFAIDTLERFDAAKRSIDGMISETRNDNVKRLLVQMKNDMLDAVHGGSRSAPTLNIAYADARSAWGSRAELLESAQMGRQFMRGTGDVTAAEINALPNAAKKMALLGAQRELQIMLGGKALGPTADYTRTLYQPNVYSRIAEITPQGKTSEKLGELVRREKRISSTSAEVLGNSKTAQRGQDDLEFAGRDLLGTGWKAWRQSGGVINLGLDLMKAGAERAFGFRDDMALALAKRLTEATPAQQDVILTRLAQRIGQSKVDQFLGFVQQASLPATAAGVNSAARGTAAY